MLVKFNKYKKEYFENLNVVTNSKRFWDKCKWCDSNKTLIEKDKLLLKNKIADVLNYYFD